MSRKEKILKKNRLKRILNGSYETLDINETYLIATNDYSKQELQGIISVDPNKTPLWDWFTLVNKKRNKIWYIDFSMPYIWENFFDSKKDEQIERIYKMWALEDIPIVFKNETIKGGMFILNYRNPDFDSNLEKRQEYYLNNNDWDKTLEQYKKDNDFNKNWNEGIQIYLNKESDGFGIVIPVSYKNKTFLEVFTEVIKLFSQSKFNQDAYKLIEEIQFKKFIK